MLLPLRLNLQAMAVVAGPSVGGGGGYSRQIIHRHFEDDAEEIFMMMVNAFMRTQ